MKKKLALLLTHSMALSLTAYGGGNKATETMAAPETTTITAAEATKEESRDDAAGTTAAEAADGGVDALIEATKAEGELTVYGSCEEGHLSAACQDFEKLYGVKTKYQRPSTSEACTKIPEGAGKPSVGVRFGRTTGPHNEAVIDGLLVEYDAINTKSLIGDQYKDPANCWYDTYKDILGSMINTEELDHLGLKAPKTWGDLTKEGYKGLIMLSDPNMADTAKLLIDTAVQMKGHDGVMEYLRILDKNISQYTKSGSGLPKMVDSGECVIGTGSLHDGIYRILQGYDNIQLIVPKDGTFFEVGATTVFNGCAHPNAAKLQIGYVLSPDRVDHTKENGSYQFLVPNNATQPEGATKFGLDINNTIDYDFRDVKESSAKYVRDFFAALESSFSSVDSSCFLTE